jgi:hypothetical protein
MFSSYNVTKEGFRFPFGWNDSTNTFKKNRDNCYRNCDEQAKQKSEELMQMKANGSYSRDEIRKKGDEIRKLKMDCAKNCDSAY